MKIGIMSMQRIQNYGSFLQAYGLKKTIENLGHEVVFVDYKVEKPIVEYKDKGRIYKLTKKAYHVIKRNFQKDGNLTQLYDTKYLSMLGVSKQKNYRDKVDVLVIGSDEVFNCLQANPNVGYSKELFGKNNNAKKVISYAASAGHTTLAGLKKYNLEHEVGSLLKNFSQLSVRDKNTYETVFQLTGKEPNLNVDPVIITNFDHYIPKKPELKDYILVYAYGNRIKEKEEITAIKEFAKKYNKKLISIGTHQDWTDLKIEADPFELLSYVKGADYVITDTFHGSIFSLKYNRPFATIIRKSNQQKISDLLIRFAVQDREVKNIADLEKVLLQPIDYKKVNEIVLKETERSITYLTNNLK